VGNCLDFQENLESGIYQERPFFYVKAGMILIGSKGIQEDPGIFSLHLTVRNAGSFCLWEKGRQGCSVLKHAKVKFVRGRGRGLQ